MTKREQFRKVVATMVDNKVSERHIAGALGISRTTVWQIKQDLKAEKGGRQVKGTPVPAGTTISVSAGLPSRPRQFIVKEPCQSSAGNWACVTHDRHFTNNLQASIHEDDDVDHDIVWECWEHGPETVPAGTPVKAGVTE